VTIRFPIQRPASLRHYPAHARNPADRASRHVRHSTPRANPQPWAARPRRSPPRHRRAPPAKPQPVEFGSPAKVQTVPAAPNNLPCFFRHSPLLFLSRETTRISLNLHQKFYRKHPKTPRFFIFRAEQGKTAVFARLEHPRNRPTSAPPNRRKPPRSNLPLNNPGFQGLFRP